MASIATSQIAIPVEVANDIFTKAYQGSTLAMLSAQRAQKFGTSQEMVLTGAPVAELVGEGAEKSPTPATFAPKAVVPRKFQVTVRVNEEVKWADEDHQLDVWQTISDAAGNALGRALDLVGYHKLNPLAGTVASSVSEGITDTTLSATVSGGDYEAAIEAAEGLIIAKGYDPTGLALAPSAHHGFAHQKDADGRRLYTTIDGFDGLTVVKSSTVNAPEATSPTGILGFIGDFNAFRWGVQREIGAEMIEYGDPDGLGDLKRMNQVALRMEIVYGIGIMDLDAFAKIV